MRIVPNKLMHATTVTFPFLITWPQGGGGGEGGHLSSRPPLGTRGSVLDSPLAVADYILSPLAEQQGSPQGLGYGLQGVLRSDLPLQGYSQLVGQPLQLVPASSGGTTQFFLLQSEASSYSLVLCRRVLQGRKLSRTPSLFLDTVLQRHKNRCPI